jgi:hypothetical protein
MPGNKKAKKSNANKSNANKSNANKSNANKSNANKPKAKNDTVIIANKPEVLQKYDPEVLQHDEEPEIVANPDQMDEKNTELENSDRLDPMEEQNEIINETQSVKSSTTSSRKEHQSLDQNHDYDQGEKYDEFDIRYNESSLDIEYDEQKYASTTITGAYFSEPDINVLNNDDVKYAHIRSIFSRKNTQECTVCGEAFKKGLNKEIKLVTLGGMAGWIYCKDCEQKSIKRAILERIGDNDSVPMLWLDERCLLKFEYFDKRKHTVTMKYGRVAWNDNANDHQQRKMVYIPMMKDYAIGLWVENYPRDETLKNDVIRSVTLTNLLVNNKNLYESFVMCSNLMASPNIVISYDELPDHVKLRVETARKVELSGSTTKTYEY